MGQEQGKPLSPEELAARGLSSMAPELRRKYSRGVQYNMKVAIKGDTNTGKTCLWTRLQGGMQLPDYIQTRQIQVANIHWNYKVTDDIIKVEVWDVVDKARPSEAGEIRTSHGDGSRSGKKGGIPGMELDAESVNIYQGTHAVVLVFDVTRPWTWEYIMREFPKIPEGIEVIILANKVDLTAERKVDSVTAKSWVAAQHSPFLRYLETSVKTNFGLKGIHAFFNIPFLRIQREAMKKQLAINKAEMDKTLEELKLYTDGEDYQTWHSRKVEETRNKGVVPGATPGTAPGAPTPAPTAPAAPSGRPLPAAPGGGSPSPVSPPRADSLRAPAASPAAAAPKPAEIKAEPPKSATPEEKPKKGFFSRLKEKMTKSPAPAPAAPAEVDPNSFIKPPPPQNVKHVDDFVAGELDDNFFGDDDGPAPAAAPAADKFGDDSDEDGGANLVMADEDLEGDERQVAAIAPRATASPAARGDYGEVESDSETPAQGRGAAANATDSDDEPAAVKRLRAQNSPQPAVKPAAPAGSDSDDEPAAVKRLRAQQSQSQSQSPASRSSGAKPVVNAGGLDEDSDEGPNPLVQRDAGDSDDEPAAARKGKKGGAVAAIPADSDDDEPAAARTGKKGGVVAAVPADSDDDMPAGAKRGNPVVARPDADSDDDTPAAAKAPPARAAPAPAPAPVKDAPKRAQGAGLGREESDEDDGIAPFPPVSAPAPAPSRAAPAPAPAAKDAFYDDESDDGPNPVVALDVDVDGPVASVKTSKSGGGGLKFSTSGYPGQSAPPKVVNAAPVAAPVPAVAPAAAPAEGTSGRRRKHRTGATPATPATPSVPVTPATLAAAFQPGGGGLSSAAHFAAQPPAPAGESGRRRKRHKSGEARGEYASLDGPSNGSTVAPAQAGRNHAASAVAAPADPGYNPSDLDDFYADV